MKSLRYILIASVALFALAACAQEEDPYKPGDPTNSNGHNVFFSAENPGTLVLGLADNSFTVKIERENANGAISVPLKAYSASNVFAVPSSVDFAAGETSKEITVQFSGAEPFVNYSLQISVPQEFTYQYKDQNVYPAYAVTVLQEDFKVIHTGTYFEDFWTGDTWSQDLEYSELSDTYRFSNLWDIGYGFTFKWDGQSEEVVVNNGNKFESGIVSGTYGMISAEDQGSYYDDGENAIHFVFKWTVSAGSFGNYENVFYF